MKHHLKRTFVTLLAGALLLCSASCGKRDSWLPFGEKKSACERAYDSLEAQFAELRTAVAGGASAADRAAFWQAAAALFVVLSGFALVGGAALGSAARRARGRFRRAAGAGSPSDDTSEELPA